MCITYKFCVNESGKLNSFLWVNALPEWLIIVNQTSARKSDVEAKPACSKLLS
jgi:hypothetical protein